MRGAVALRCARIARRARGIGFTIINMTLVRTPMVAPTKIYEHFSLMDADQAAELVAEASGREPMADGEASPAMIAFASLRRGVQW